MGSQYGRKRGRAPVARCNRLSYKASDRPGKAGADKSIHYTGKLDMPWQTHGGGGPWGGGQGPWGRGPSGGGQRPNDIEEMLRRGQDRLKGWLPGGMGGRRGLVFIALAALALWLASGFYRVDANEQG